MIYFVVKSLLMHQTTNLLMHKRVMHERLMYKRKYQTYLRYFIINLYYNENVYFYIKMFYIHISVFLIINYINKYSV